MRWVFQRGMRTRRRSKCEPSIVFCQKRLGTTHAPLVTLTLATHRNLNNVGAPSRQYRFCSRTRRKKILPCKGGDLLKSVLIGCVFLMRSSRITNYKHREHRPEKDPPRGLRIDVVPIAGPQDLNKGARGVAWISLYKRTLETTGF